VGTNFRKTISLTKNIKANISKKGVSFTGKFGPITLNSKGKGSIKLGKGINHTFKWKK
jgi:hypothetical protein